MLTVKKVTIVFWNDEKNGGEYEAAFEGAELLDAWHTNDALWRGEYYDTFLEKIGVKIDYSSCPSQEDIDVIKNHFGID